MCFLTLQEGLSEVRALLGNKGASHQGPATGAMEREGEGGDGPHSPQPSTDNCDDNSGREVGGSARSAAPKRWVPAVLCRLLVAWVAVLDACVCGWGEGS